jgi:hypothetical protein
MTPVTKQAWIDALRSGEFNQCTGALGKLNPEGGINYCCLGVLATLAGAGHRVDANEGNDILVFEFEDGAEDSGVIPASCRATIVDGLNLEALVDNPALADPGREDDLMRTLSSKNDRGATFAEIADYLENLP